MFKAAGLFLHTQEHFGIQPSLEASPLTLWGSELTHLTLVHVSGTLVVVGVGDEVGHHAEHAVREQLLVSAHARFHLVLQDPHVDVKLKEWKIFEVLSRPEAPFRIRGHSNLLEGADQLLPAVSQVLHGSHHAARRGEEEQARVQAGFARSGDENDLRPGRNLLLSQHLEEHSACGTSAAGGVRSVKSVLVP